MQAATTGPYCHTLHAGDEYEELAEDQAGDEADEDAPEAHFGLPGAEDGFGDVEVIED